MCKKLDKKWIVTNFKLERKSLQLYVDELSISKLVCISSSSSLEIAIIFSFFFLFDGNSFPKRKSKNMKLIFCSFGALLCHMCSWTLMECVYRCVVIFFLPLSTVNPLPPSILHHILSSTEKFFLDCKREIMDMRVVLENDIKSEFDWNWTNMKRHCFTHSFALARTIYFISTITKTIFPHSKQLKSFEFTKYFWFVSISKCSREREWNQLAKLFFHIHLPR